MTLTTINNRYNMTEESQVVTAPVETQGKPDTIEVETNIEATPKNGSPDNQPTAQADAPKPAETQEQKKTRQEKRRAARERDIRRNADLEAEVRLLREQKQATAPQGKTPYTDFSKEPNIADYDDALAYTRDVNKYDAHNMLSERDKKQQTERAQESTNQAYFEKLRPLVQANPEMADRITYLDSNGLISKQLEAAVKSSSVSEKITEYLIGLPDEAIAQISQLPANELYKGIGILEAQLSQVKEEKPRTTQAPPAIKPPGNSAKTDRSIGSFTQEEIENMPISEFKKLTNMK